MKTIRTHFLAKPLSCFLAFLVLFISCSAPDEEIVFTHDADLQGMSGEQLFRSVLFKEGDFGKQLYSEYDLEVMNKMDSKLIALLEKAKNQIVADINESRSGYFHSFKSAMLSKDHNLMMNALIDARNVVKETVKKRHNLTEQ